MLPRHAKRNGDIAEDVRIRGVTIDAEIAISDIDIPKAGVIGIIDQNAGLESGYCYSLESAVGRID